MTQSDAMNRDSACISTISMSDSCACRKSRPFDLMKESRNVGHDGRAALLAFEAGGFAVQVAQPLEAENAALRRQLIVLQRQVRGRVQFHEQRSPVLPAIVSVVSIDRGGDDDRPRDAGAMASGAER